MKLSDLPTVQCDVEMARTLIDQIELIDLTPGTVTVKVGHHHPPVYIGDRIAPHVRAVLIDHVRRCEDRLTKAGVELEPAFPNEISSSAAGDSATGAREQAENAPNAGEENRIWWVLCESEWGTTLDHFYSEAEQLAKVAEHLRLFWTRDREDEPIPADMEEAVEKLTEMGDSKLHSLRWESLGIKPD
jgi:hypothetical protein